MRPAVGRRSGSWSKNFKRRVGKREINGTDLCCPSFAGIMVNYGIILPQKSFKTYISSSATLALLATLAVNMFCLVPLFGFL